MGAKTIIINHVNKTAMEIEDHGTVVTVADAIAVGERMAEAITEYFDIYPLADDEVKVMTPAWGTDEPDTIEVMKQAEQGEQ